MHRRAGRAGSNTSRFPLGVALVVLSFIPRQAWFDQTLRYTMQGLALMPIFLVAVRYPGWAPCRPLNHPWVKLVGVLSYAIYLVHTTVIRLVELVTASPLALALLSGAATLLVAYILHRTAELPFIQWRKRLGGPRAAVPAAPSSRTASSRRPAGLRASVTRRKALAELDPALLELERREMRQSEGRREQQGTLQVARELVALAEPGVDQKAMKDVKRERDRRDIAQGCGSSALRRCAAAGCRASCPTSAAAR